MAITTEDIKKLRDETGVSVMQCKKALEEADGDMEKARIILRKQSGAAAAKKAGRSLGAGRVQAYIHAGGTVGAMVLLSSETDFVSKNEEFRQLAYAIAMQVAATNPEYLRREDVPAEAEATARSVFEGEVAGKPADLQEKILSGKLDAYFRDKILLTQPYIKDPERTIEQLIEEAIQKFGERIEISQFVRFAA
jgi:elongation factor Ts